MSAARVRPGVIGLGSMGGGAARALVRAGFETLGCDLNPAALANFEALGGRIATDPASLAADADVVLVFVVNADQVHEVVFGSGATKKPGTPSCATSSPSGRTIRRASSIFRKPRNDFTTSGCFAPPMSVSTRIKEVGNARTS